MRSKVIPGFPDYEITDSGKVFSNKRGSRVELSPSTTNGYEKVTLSNKSKKGNFQVHRLVAQAFIKNPKRLTIVNHRDGSKTNNKLANLEWVSRKGNGEHYAKTLAPKYAAARKKKQSDVLQTKLSILNFAHSQLDKQGDTTLFFSLYQTMNLSK